jgi:hypothetical protein
MNATPYGFRIVGDCTGERRLIDHAAAFRAYAACDDAAQVNREAYMSAFAFADDFRQHLTARGTTKAFTGVCGAPVIWWDIDRAGDLPKAQDDAGRLASALVERYRIADDALPLFFSGSKGFHVGLPCSLWAPTPSADFHRIARQFCESIAQGVGVTTDTGVYDKVRAFRAPNSRHPKILAQAKQPAPFEIVNLVPNDGDSARALEDWTTAAISRQQVRQQAEAKAGGRQDSTGPTLNRLTVDFIRNGAGTGDRHRLLFSAAANLAEFGCPPALAHAVLTESGLDTGLSPSEVRRQIDCGLEHKGGAA